jgi:hypothetical protein
MNKITLYRVFDRERVVVSPASNERDWMEEDNRFAYRCLPLVIANQHGWTLSMKERTYAEWDGGSSIESVRVLSPSGGVSSHFGYGVLTFTVDCLFRLPEGYSLYITGLPNHLKDGIMPLTGIYEADWAPYSFTMNWKFTEARRTVVFEENEPFCFFFPVQRNLIESFVVETKEIGDDPVLKEQYKQWSKERGQFNASPDRKAQDWQKHYFKGEYPDGSKCPFDHKTKLNIKLE